MVMSITPHDRLPDPEDFYDLRNVVASLRDRRLQSLAARQREQSPPRLPSKQRLQEVVEALATALFPNRLGSGEVSREAIDYYVGQSLSQALRLLCEQISRELQFHRQESENSPGSDPDRDARELCRRFTRSLPDIRTLLDRDLQAAYEGDPAAQSADEILVCYPGMAAVIYHRLAHELYRLGLRLTARVIAEISHSATGIDIHPGAQIGGGFFIDHGTGVVIGETTIIGRYVRLYQAVTLGAKRFLTDEKGGLIKGNARHPILEDEVVVYAGATILGRITIGQGSTIGGNVWLTRSIPPHSHITQAAPRQDLFDLGGGI